MDFIMGPCLKLDVFCLYLANWKDQSALETYLRKGLQILLGKGAS